MSYLVIARKFRPQTFSSVVGQEHITDALANAIVRDKVPHALLFTGPRGVGKTTSARIFARAVNCQGRKLLPDAANTSPEALRESVEPCGECSNCKEIASSSSLAVWEIDGASNNGVDNVRDLIDSLYTVPPPGSRYKIYIIDEVHMLSTAAFNALLKSLEEPPPNTLFIFATTEPHKIPDTVISRCQRHDFRKLPVKQIVGALRDIAKKEGASVEDSVYELIAMRAQGGMRDAQSMLDRVIAFSSGTVTLIEVQKLFGIVDSRLLFGLSEAIFSKDVAKCFELIDTAFSYSIDIKAFIADFIRHWRNLLILSTIPKDANISACANAVQISSDEVMDYRKVLGMSSSFDIQRLFEIAEKASDTALRSAFPRYVLEAGIAKMASLPSLRPLPELIGRIEHALSSRNASSQSSAIASNTIAKTTFSVSQNGHCHEKKTCVELHDKEDRKQNDLSSNSEAKVFIPSWASFVEYVKGRSEVMLAAFLRRVTVSNFDSGNLVIMASPFDCNSLNDPNTIKTLNACLHAYSGIANWKVKVSEFEVTSNKEEPLNTITESSQSANVDSYIKGSIAAKEKERNRVKREEVKKEAQNDSSIQTVLDIFQGSKIEKVAVLGQKGRE